MRRQEKLGSDRTTGAIKLPRGRSRLDALLVERGLAQSREAAQEMIADGRVRVNDGLATRPAALTDANAALSITPGPAYVSRGGNKLAGALDSFGVSPRDAVCIDIGASTGGFTDCLLQRGAARVYAVDVGYGQLAWKLRSDDRVVAMERRNARHPLPIEERADLATVDVSFISLRLVLPSVMDALSPGGRILALVKPQFEAGRSDVGRGGVVRSPAARARTIGSIALWAIDNGLGVLGVRESVLTGPKGNHEYFLLLQKPED